VLVVEMGNLSLVKSLSHLKEEQKHSDEIFLKPVGLAFTRGSLAEISGEPSSGKTSLSLSLLSKLTQEGEVCAVVDSSNSFDPCSATLAGIALENLLWVKCDGNMENAFTAADYLVQAKGFGAIWLNLNGISKQKLRRVPRTYWYRYRTRIKETPTFFLITAEEPVAGSASQQSFVFSRQKTIWSGTGRFKLLREFHLSLHSKKQFYGKPLLTKIEFDYSDV
jgi:energy-coupling factor transporter ATP-binding protein EcfA2